MHKIDLRRIDLNLLPVFDVLMRERHVSRAAEQLGRTQSAISHALDRLRDQLGDPLLVRVGGAMQPSPFAIALMDELGPILGSIERALAPREPFDPATSQRKFRLVLPDFWTGAMAGFFAKAASVAPDITVEWLAPREDSLIDLAAGQVDLVIARSRLAAIEGVQSRSLGAMKWQSFLRAGHPAIAQWGIDVWLAYPHVLVAVGDRLSQPIQAALHQTSDRRIGVRVPGFSTVAPLLARTDMIATLPALTMEGTAAFYGLVALPPPVPVEPIEQSLYWSIRHSNEPALVWLREKLLPLLTIPS